MKLPDKLTRKALKRCFPLVSEATWDYAFDVEKRNGLARCRVVGPDCLVYYDVEAIKLWLIERGYYTPSDFTQPVSSAGRWEGLSIRRHALAG